MNVLGKIFDIFVSIDLFYATAEKQIHILHRQVFVFARFIRTVNAGTSEVSRVINTDTLIKMSRRRIGLQDNYQTHKMLNIIHVSSVYSRI